MLRIILFEGLKRIRFQESNEMCIDKNEFVQLG